MKRKEMTIEEIEKQRIELKKKFTAAAKQLDKMKKNNEISTLEAQLQKIAEKISHYEYEIEEQRRKEEEQKATQKLLGGQKSLVKQWLKDEDGQYYYMTKKRGEDYEGYVFTIAKIAEIAEDNTIPIYKEAGEYKLAQPRQTTINIVRTEWNKEALIENECRVVSSIEIPVMIGTSDTALLEQARKPRGGEDFLLIGGILHEVVGEGEVYD